MPVGVDMYHRQPTVAAVDSPLAFRLQRGVCSSSREMRVGRDGTRWTGGSAAPLRTANCPAAAAAATQDCSFHLGLSTTTTTALETTLFKIVQVPKRANCLAKIRAALEAGAVINARVTALVAAGAELSCSASNGQRLLHVTRHLDTALLLVRLGASLSLRDTPGALRWRRQQALRRLRRCWGVPEALHPLPRSHQPSVHHESPRPSLHSFRLTGGPRVQLPTALL